MSRNGGRQRVKRYGHVIRVKPGMLGRYKQLHAAVWPEILRLVHDSNLRNYTIYSKDDYLFAYYEYVGEDFAADMARIAASDINTKWQAVCGECFLPLDSRRPGEVWAGMEDIFHMD
jgi:L-rhamnose mutarotase